MARNILTPFTFAIGGNTITNATNVVGLKIVANASQSADIFQIRNSADSANFFSIGSGGAITTASALTVNGLSSFNNNINAYGTSTFHANQQLSLAVRNGANYAGNLVQHSLNDSTVTGGVSARGLIFAGSTGFENNPTYNLSATNPFLTSNTAIFTVSTVQTYNPFAVGQKIIVSSASQAQYNGSWITTAVGGTSGAWTVSVVAGGTTTPFTNGGSLTATGTIAVEPAGFFKQPSPGAIGLVIKGAGASGTATDVFRYVDSAGTTKTQISAAGDITAPAISAIWSITSSAQDVTVNAMRARTSQATGYRANLQTWENSTTVLAGINSPGKFFTGGTSGITVGVGGTIQSIAAGANPLVTMASAHGLAVGDVVVLAGTTGGTYNGTFYVATVPASTTFTITSALTAGQAGAAGTVAVAAQVSVISRSASVIGVAIRAVASQTADTLQVQDSSGVILAKIDSVGAFTTNSANGYSIAGAATFRSLNSGQTMLLTAGSTVSTNPHVVIRQSASQTGDLTQWQTSTPTTVASISSAGAFTATGDISTGGVLKSTFSSGDEGGGVDLTKSVTNTVLTTGVSIDVYQNKLRFFETGGSARGFYIDISTGANSAGTNLAQINVNATAKTGAYTLATTDYNTMVQMNGAFAFTVGTGLYNAPVGTQIHLLALTSGVTVAASGAGVTVNATPGLKLRAQYSAATLICLASSASTCTWLLTGDLSA